MNVYLDTSAIVPLFAVEQFSARVRTFLSDHLPSIVISSFGVAEFSSGIARLVRDGALTRLEAGMAFSNFDGWARREAQLIDIAVADIATANTMVRQIDLGLRVPDAIHLAITQRLDLTLATFDKQMAAAARKLRVKLAKL